MWTYRGLIVIVICLVVFADCGGESEKLEPTIKEGTIQGKVMDSETSAPVKEASITIDSQTATSDKDGNYIISGITFTDKLDVVVSASEYKDFKGTVYLQQELLVFNVSLVPINSEKAKVLDVLEGLSEDIEALDPARIPAIQGRLSKDYTVGVNEATAFGVLFGVIPPSYEDTPQAIEKIIETSDKLLFTFSEPKITLNGDTASVETFIEIYIETKQKPNEPGNKIEMSIMGEMNFRKEGNDWKMIFWQLVGDFLKFIKEPLL